MRHRDVHFDDPAVRARRWFGRAFWIVLYAAVVLIVVLTIDFIDPTVFPTWLIVLGDLAAAISVGWWLSMLYYWLRTRGEHVRETTT